MQEIIQAIAQKAGIAEDQAKTAFDTALAAIKEKMPESIASQVDGLLTGQKLNVNALISDKLNDLKEDAAEKLDELKEDAAEKFEDLKEGLKKMF